jgi:hypothetical protein
MASFNPAGMEHVPVEALRCGEPFTDVDGDGHFYKVLESRSFDSGCVVLELESHHQGEGQVIEKSFPMGYMVARSLRRML